MNACRVIVALSLLVGLVACGTSASDVDDDVDAAAPLCSASGTIGIQIGDIVPNIQVRDCESSPVFLHDLICGQSLSLIDLGAGAFASCVEETDEYAVAPEYDDLQARGLQIVQVFVGDEQLDLPTSLFCREYSADHAIDFEFLIDPLLNTSLLSELYPFNLVVDSEGRIVEKWVEVIPADKVDILGSMLPQ